MEYLLKRYKKLNQKERKGFTLVELLVVIAILAVLASVSVVGYLGFTTKAKNSNALTELSQAKEAIRAELIGGTQTYHVYATSNLIKTTTATTEANTNESYTITFTYAKSSDDKISLTYTCVKDTTANTSATTITDAKWDTILKKCFTDLASLNGTFEVTANSGSITDIKYFTKDEKGSASWTVSTDELKSGEQTKSDDSNVITIYKPTTETSAEED